MYVVVVYLVHSVDKKASIADGDFGEKKRQLLREVEVCFDPFTLKFY